MITSRGLNLLKFVYSNSQRKVAATNLRTVRLGHDSHYHGSYRDQFPPIDKKEIIAAEIFGGFMWWWILWHFWHDFGHIVGEFPYPDPSEWTDEELGIPPDEDGPLSRINIE
ncbi:NADH dehydrogenase [ubiquinone] 1 beta subcomplex subunit 2, mitochondrial-like [Pseudomyrmex gracilis]|uniref:NADH dehydrogenase [ubiquinone] 1 beta subcomplex subunit 2, mitochondrial-like n=1 Tax=Pseudomyrmex gracilis TaxID=219809 RepID=UPI0009957E75|nr:NADH dehydrogenase [ubiquinone] 1 beta subcomplex subunit 2, mitochondrial-like [Pseudomyrmex gracilis]